MNQVHERGATIKRNPLIHARPDYKNKNIIKSTSSPVKQVQQYLQSIRNHHVEEYPHDNPLMPSSRSQSQSQNPYKYQSNQQEILRNRIQELQVQNNQFRSLYKEYEILVKRNKELEEHMMELLEAIQNREKNGSFYEIQQISQNQEQGFSFSKTKVSPLSKEIETKPTENTILQNSHEENIKIINDSSPEVKDFSPSNSIRQRQLQEQNEFLKMQNKSIFELFENSIKQYLKNIEDKFVKYIQAMEERFKRLDESKNNEKNLKKVIQNEKGFEDGSSSQQKKNYQSNIFPQRLDNVEYYTDINLYCTPHSSRENQPNSNIKEITSRINISLQNLSNSSERIIKQRQEKLYITPASQYGNYYKDVQVIQSSKPEALTFQHLVVQKIFQNISQLKQNLVYVWNKKNVLTDSFSFFEKRIQFQLKGLLETYFETNGEGIFSKQSPQKKDHLLLQNQELKEKIKEINQQIGYLKLQLSFKIESQESNSNSLRNRQGGQFSKRKIKLSNKRQMDSQQLQNIHRQYAKQFQLSKSRLIQVIEVIRAFNDEYGQILKTRRDSIVQQMSRRST